MRVLCIEDLVFMKLIEIFRNLKFYDFNLCLYFSPPQAKIFEMFAFLFHPPSF